jgi:hypothetical protein
MGSDHSQVQLRLLHWLLRMRVPLPMNDRSRFASRPPALSRLARPVRPASLRILSPACRSAVSSVLGGACLRAHRRRSRSLRASRGEGFAGSRGLRGVKGFAGSEGFAGSGLVLIFASRLRIASASRRSKAGPKRVRTFKEWSRPFPWLTLYLSSDLRPAGPVAGAAARPTFGQPGQ